MKHREIDSDKRERVIAAFAASWDCSLDEIRDVYTREYARLEAGAKVLAHLDALVASKVKSILRRTASRKH